jgi:indole-3-glycerol phosphate synthase
MDIERVKENKFFKTISNSYLYEMVKIVADYKKIKHKSFYDSVNNDELSIICEIKRQDFYGDSKDYEFDKKFYSTGLVKYSHALSVVTVDEFFDANPSYIEEIRGYVDLPILQRDIIVSPIQIYEAKKVGASAVSFIVKVMDERTLAEYINICNRLNLDAVMEVYDERDIEKSINCDASIICLTNREKEIDFDYMKDLIDSIPDDILVIFQSYFNNPDDINIFKELNVQALIINNLYTKYERESFFEKLEVIN